jgi:hypothetical protein
VRPERLGKFKSYPRNRPWSPIGFEMIRIPHCLDNRLIDGGEDVSPTQRQHFTPQKHSSSLMFPVLISVRG